MSTVMYAFRARSDDHLAEQVAAVRDINKKRIKEDGSGSGSGEGDGSGYGDGEGDGDD